MTNDHAKPTFESPTLPRADRRWWVALLIVMALFCAAMASYSVLRHHNLWSDVYDLGQEIQVHWNTAHGRPFESSVEVQNNLGDHVTFVNLITAVPYRIFNAPETLLILQPIIFALGALAVFRIGLFYLHSAPLAWTAAVAYLAQPATGYALGYEYHPMVYCAPFALWCFDAAIRGRLKLAAVLFVCVLGCREDAGMAAAAVGVFVLFATPYRKTGVVMTLLGLAWFVTAMFVLLPYFRGGPSDSIDRFAFFGDSSREVMTNILTRPDMIIDRLMQDTRRITFIPHLSLAWMGTSLLTVAGWVGLILTAGLGILSSSDTKWTIGASQPLVILPIVTIAGILGLRRMMRWFPQLATPRGAAVVMTLWLAALAAQNLDSVFVRNRWQMTYNPLRDELAQLRPLIPDDAALSATSKMGAQFAQRPQLAIYPITAWDPAEFPKVEKPRAEYVLIQTTQARLEPEHVEPDLTQYELLRSTEQLRLYRLRGESDAAMARVE